MYLNFELAKKYGGSCHIRIDDTDPSKERGTYVEAILRDASWMGYGTSDVRYASDYFDRLYEQANRLIKLGHAYVDGHSSDEFAQLYKGTPTQPGRNSPHRSRSIEENLRLFEEMKNGDSHADGLILRAKIDMSAPNMHLRDPAIYRMKRVPHYRSGAKWSIYPMYDFAHCLCDAFEGITHSLCSLEFEVHRPLYEWFLSTLKCLGPRQIEFARLSLSHTVLSKRKLALLIKQGYASGWDDVQLPTLSGLRRRGYTPAALCQFIERSGISKRNALIDNELLGWALREELNQSAPRRMVALRPLKIQITNYPEEQREWLDAQNNPQDPESGHRKLLFGPNLYIDQSDFETDPPPKFFRLAPGREVRLKYAYIIRCEEVVRDAKGSIKKLLCTYDPNTRSGTPGAARHVKGTLGWVAEEESLEAEILQYHTLFTQENPEIEEDYLKGVNPSAIERIQGARLEASLNDAAPRSVYQFERQGYYCRDEQQSNLFHQTIPLKDSYKKG